MPDPQPETPAVPDVTPAQPATIDAIRSGDPDMMRRLLARTWLELQGDTSLAHAIPGTRIRHSWAAKCARALRYNIDGVDPSEPPDVASQWVFRLGHLVHDEVQGALLAMFEAAGMPAEIEVKKPNLNLDGSFTLDVEIRYPGGDDPAADVVHVVEIKSMGGFAFKGVVGTRGKAPGPRHSAFLQLALNAAATPQCTGGWMIVAATENISVNESERHDLTVLDRFLYVRYYPIEQLAPFAEAEERRMAVVLEQSDKNVVTPRQIPDPEIPPDARVTDPSKGTWQVIDGAGNILDVGSTWQCDYCDFRSKCIEDGP